MHESKLFEALYFMTFVHTEITEEGVQFRSPYAASPVDVDISFSADADLCQGSAKKQKRGGTFSGKRRNSASSPRAKLDCDAGVDCADENKQRKKVEPADKVDAADMMLLTPEESIRLQNGIGADIIMQLDDVVSSLTTGPRVTEAMHRTIRWFARCSAAHARPREQNLFPIVQGGLDANLRRQCAQQMVEKNSQIAGYAIGGLSGGEAKDKFWRMVSVSTDVLPNDKPRYVMGVGYAVDLVVCVALGV